MDEGYDFKASESQIRNLWEEGGHFAPQDGHTRRPFSMFLVPPNASGPLHVGNALMIAIQDVLARYHRAKGDPTLWIPGTDHGGYETQVTFEKELEKEGKDKGALSRTELFKAIEQFVAKNNETIILQTKELGASVDWTRFRFTLDEDALAATDQMFRKMVADGLIYRRSYMVNYCPHCATMLADIELKEKPVTQPRYFVTFPFQDEPGHVILPTTRPEFLFSVTHVLVHPEDSRHSHLIGKTLRNPTTGAQILIVESKRKFDAKNTTEYLEPFCPSFNKYDYGYTLRNELPARNLLDWEGKLIDRFPGLAPEDARVKEVRYLTDEGFIDHADESFTDSRYLCKKGHGVEIAIRQTWFLRLDDDRVAIRKPTIEALDRSRFAVHPHWRMKGLREWIGKMPDWPIARQNAWGIRIPIWYEVSEPREFMVWFIDKQGTSLYGNLQDILDKGIPLQEVSDGLQRLYAGENCTWTMQPESGKSYLPETDTFDTWFSSGAWSTIVYGRLDSPDLKTYYPSEVIVIGHDLLRLSIAREILLSHYLTGSLPTRAVYFHRLLKGKDGQKMSKSLGNYVDLDHYLSEYGADVTRMALISYTSEREDFILSDERLNYFRAFAERLWNQGRVCELANRYVSNSHNARVTDSNYQALLGELENLAKEVSRLIEKYAFAKGQERLVTFLDRLEHFVASVHARKDLDVAMAVYRDVFHTYLGLLHPFMPFMTEALYTELFDDRNLLANAPWPGSLEPASR
jgi:valyl-tRNA synthetase